MIRIEWMSGCVMTTFTAIGRSARIAGRVELAGPISFEVRHPVKTFKPSEPPPLPNPLDENKPQKRGFRNTVCGLLN